jgi:Zn-dependent protease
MNETLLQAAILVPCLVIAIVTHEVAHGLMALRLGDTTARDLGRLSLNPLRHVDVVGTLLVPGALALSGGPVFGWAKPVPVRASGLNNPRRDMMIVGAAGPAVNFLLALLAAVLLGLAARLMVSTDAVIPDIMAEAALTFIGINVFLGLFNLLPIPPFDGSHIVQGLLPERLARAYGRLQKYGMLVFAALIAVTWLLPDLDPVGRVFNGPFEWVMDQLFSLAAVIAGR